MCANQLDVESQHIEPVGLSAQIKSKCFNDGTTVLKGINIEVPPGTFATILGRSGVGKSTLLRIIAGLDADYKGSVIVDGKNVNKPLLNAGIVFQDSRLLPWMTVTQNIEYGLPNDVDDKVRLERVASIVQAVGLADSEHKLPRELSGGMQRRTALGRALVRSPRILLLDEPFSALDISSKHVMQDLLGAFHRDRNLTTILITHDIEEATYLSDQIFFLIDPLHGNIETVELDSDFERKRCSEQFASNFMKVSSKAVSCMR